MRTLRQALTLYRPGDIPKIEADVTYDQFDGLKGIFDDDETPSQQVLLDVDYSKLNTVTLWAKYGQIAGKDYESTRANIYKAMLMAGGFDVLNAAEKDLCIIHHVIPTETQEQYYSDEELIDLGAQYDAWSTASRVARYERAKIILLRSIVKADVQKITSEILDEGLDRTYMEAGIRGLLFGDEREGLLDYINASKDSPYEFTGVRVQPYTPKINKGTIADICDRLISIAMEDLT